MTDKLNVTRIQEGEYRVTHPAHPGVVLTVHRAYTRSYGERSWTVFGVPEMRHWTCPSRRAALADIARWYDCLSTGKTFLR